MGITADFEWTPTTGPAPLEVDFTSSYTYSGPSTGPPTDIRWYFTFIPSNPFLGAAESTEEHPTWTFTDPGTYRVTLAAFDSAGSFNDSVFYDLEVTEGGGGTTPVGKAVELLWHVRDAVGGDRDAVWDVADAAGGTARLEWDVAKAVGKTRQPKWGVFDAVGKTGQAVWNVAAPSGPIPPPYLLLMLSPDDPQTGEEEVPTAVGKSVQVVWDTESSLTADFTFSPASGPAPLEVDFTDLSTSSYAPVDSWTWYFRWPSTAHTSGAQNPTHTYPEPGLYSVRLVVTAGGDAAEAYKTVLVLDGGDGPPELALWLVTGGHEAETAGVTLAMTGSGLEAEGLDLYLQNLDEMARTLPLYVSGFPGQTALLPLVVFGGFTEAGELPFVVEGDDDSTPEDEGLNLFVSGGAAPSAARGLDLVVGGTPLSTGDGFGESATEGLNLFLRGALSGSETAGLNLAVTGGYLSAAGTLPLLLEGSVSTCPVSWQTWTELWSETSSVWGCDADSLTATAGLELALAGSMVGLSEAGMNLFLAGPDGAEAGLAMVMATSAVEEAGLDLAVSGAFIEQQGIDLSLPEAAGASDAGQRLFVRGW